MKTLRSSVVFLIILLTGSSTICSATFKDETSAYPMQFLNRQLTLILINDNFSPPPASRVYVYTSIAAYTVLTESAGKLNLLRPGIIEYPKFDVSQDKSKTFSPSVASAYAFYYLSKKLIYTFEPFDDSFKVLLNWYRAGGCTEKEISNAQEVAKKYTDVFGDWVDKDNFGEVKRMPKYSLDDEPGHWTPTYPGYMSALEPNWEFMRHLMASSSKIDLSKFTPLPYDTIPGSPLYKEALMVNTVENAPTKEQLAVADFWDCNAFEIFPSGHYENVIKKMSPGGHWMNIVGIVSRVNGADIYKSAFAYAMTATALYEAFIYTWKLKYQYKVMRPETYLHYLGYPDFKPYLQSPPFPEYPSGHAVISMASATVLTHIFGKDFHFADNTEDAWNIPARSFGSFTEAATEAGISRFYGGIHYKYSCTDGSKMGAIIGHMLLNDIKR